MSAVYVQTAAVSNNVYAGLLNEYLPFDAKVTIFGVAVTDTDRVDFFLGSRQVAVGLSPDIQATAKPVIPDNLLVSDVARAGTQIRIPVTAVTTMVRLIVMIEPI